MADGKSFPERIRIWHAVLLVYIVLHLSISTTNNIDMSDWSSSSVYMHWVNTLAVDAFAALATWAAYLAGQNSERAEVESER